LKPDIRSSSPRASWFIAGIVVALAATIVLVAMVMRPPASDLLHLVTIFAISAGISAVVGFVAQRLGWWRRLPSLRSSLTLGYVIAAGLTMINVWLAARLMFLSSHDLTLASLLLFFAGGISVSFGFLVSNAITHALGSLVIAASQLSEGDFAVRVPVDGRDEVAQLGVAFNAMAERLQEAAAEARRLDAARRDFVAWASHDLRTPLSSLMVMIQAIDDGVVTDPATVSRYLKQSRAEIRRMGELIDALFQLSKLDTGQITLQMEQSSLSDLISDTLEAFGARARAQGVSLCGTVSADLDPVWMSPQEIGRVLQNLVDNALRYTPEGGEVRVQAECDGTTVVVSVANTGPGIPAQDLPHIFDRFYRGEPSRTREGFDRGGAGLGLAIAKGMVEAHGGVIWAESSPGKGSTFRFRMARVPGARNEPAPAT
jgi:signal transduction histidine kinase